MTGTRLPVGSSGSATICPLDMLIAAHALSLGSTLVTNNEGEFRRVPGLRCENWT
jgi:tRNA(fMet)-specific endonuclease VapC